MPRLRRCLALLPGLLLAAVAGGHAAELRVLGNVTSDVIAVGYGIDGRQVGERHTEHMGSTGWVAATAAGVGRSQLLVAGAPMAAAQLALSGHARLGDLGIAGEALASVGEPDGIRASAYGGVHAEWFTHMRLLSDTLPDGTPVQLQFTLVVDGVGVLLSDEGGSNYLLAQFSMPGLGLPQGAGRFMCEDFYDTCQRHETYLLTGRIGTEYALRGQLDLGVLASASHQGPLTNIASVAAGNSAHLYLDLQTPGVRYELDDSGLQFERAPQVNPVAEPPALAVLLLAIGLLSLRRRWRH